MQTPAFRNPPQRWLPCLMMLCALALAGCAGLIHREPVRVNVVGLEPLPGQGMEMRFAVKLRVQNPNDAAIDFDGLVLELDLDGKPFATGVSDQRGTVPRFGEAVVGVPVTVSTAAVLRQALGVIEGRKTDGVPYTLRGRLAGGVLGGVRFSDTGTLSLPDTLKTPR
ncbi:LEA type 2 family protein [Thauera linaloolentis]|uniref:Water stress and Hypersensitive response domain-containing protein n=1 Tax=Thauera linaloolentis (strain DSM 12138 / JCM 21573 / CCUG 41526 / CIP 105981 / IAM 15112 / NBRC 102519 / 47Lol) TaxID=1123367 RepID=N6YXR9_THAL4|nr:LEA type 2 family protein [Thauera linaloolentis]ENO87212.1 Water stress and Hypersensitive response domain-containing protein [Thauera linaloolentis 47Lol = DSM 12138]MCM8567365.1 LEA type 2 family protein [Thauera linaloolentis]